MINVNPDKPYPISILGKDLIKVLQHLEQQPFIEVVNVIFSIKSQVERFDAPPPEPVPVPEVQEMPVEHMVAEAVN